MAHRTCKCWQFDIYLHVRYLCIRMELVEKIALLCVIKAVYHPIDLHFFNFRASLSIVEYSSTCRERVVLSFS